MRHSQRPARRVRATPALPTIVTSSVAVGVCLGALCLCGCGGSQRDGAMLGGLQGSAGQNAGRGTNDHSRCDYRGRSDREAVETAGPGALQPNVRRVYQIVGSGEAMHKVLACREIDTNLDGIKDIVRTYNEKGESLHEEADTNYDGRIDVWTTFGGGRIGREELDTNFDGRPDLWKYYVAGRLSRIQRDTNRDGKPDQWEFYTNGKLERVGIDSDFDGQVDRWDRDQAMKLAEEAEAAGQSQGQGAKATPASTSPSAPSPAGSATAGPATAGPAATKKP